MPNVNVIHDFIEWEGLSRPDEDSPCVRVHFTASGWVPYAPATYWQPAEGGLFEDIVFVGAYVDPRDNLPELADTEIAAAKAWFWTEEAQELAQQDAEYAMRLRDSEF